MDELKELTRRLNESEATILRMNQERAALFEEVQVKTCADNIRLIEKMQEVFELFRYVPENLTEQEVVSAITQYDGDGSKPYCDLVYCGLSIIRKYLRKRSEYDEWRKGNLPEGF